METVFGFEWIIPSRPKISCHFREGRSCRFAGENSLSHPLRGNPPACCRSGPQKLMTTHYGNLPLSAFPFDIFPLRSICSTPLTFTLYGVDISPLGSIIRPISKNRQSGRSNSPHPSPESRRRCKGGGGQAANGPARAGPNPLWAVGPDVFRVKERKSGQKRAFCQTWVAPQASPVPSPWKQGGEGLFLLPQS